MDFLQPRSRAWEGGWPPSRHTYTKWPNLSQFVTLFLLSRQRPSADTVLYILLSIAPMSRPSDWHDSRYDTEARISCIALPHSLDIEHSQDAPLPQIVQVDVDTCLNLLVSRHLQHTIRMCQMSTSPSRCQFTNEALGWSKTRACWALRCYNTKI